MKPTLGQKILILILAIILVFMTFDFILSLTIAELISIIPFLFLIGGIILYIIIDNDNNCDPFC